MVELSSENIEKTVYRQLVSLGCDYGLTLLSHQTHLIHYYGPFEEVQQSIPVYENLLYGLLLMQTKLSENIHTAQEILERMLSFYHEGCFPMFVHEYPEMRDEYAGLKALLPLTLIKKHFAHVVGEPLRIKLTACIRAIITKFENADLPDAFRIRLICSEIALGHKQESDLDSFLNFELWKEWTLDYYAETLLSLYLVHPKLSDTKWRPFLEYLTISWNSTLGCYCGKPLKLRQFKHYPQITLYELFMWYLQDNVPKRKEMEKCHALLQVSLFPVALKEEVAFKETSAFVSINQKDSRFPEYEDFRSHVLFSAWGSIAKPNTLVCQLPPQTLFFGQVEDKNISDIFCSEIVGIFSFDAPLADDVPEKLHEINFYLNRDENQAPHFLVNGQHANTFQMQDNVEVLLPNAHLQMMFDVIEGKGTFKGHIMPANRPSQCADKGKDKFTCFDWKISLRTISRDDACKVRVRLAINQIN